MSLDVDTLLALMLANVFAMAVAVPVVVGRRASTSARWVVRSAVGQALAWGAFLLARPVHDRLFSTLWIALLGASFLCMRRALQGWLGRRPGDRFLAAVALLTPLGYGLGFSNYALRVGWSNLGLALLMGGVCAACLVPAPQARRGWRALIVACLGTLAVVTLARGVLGAFFTELYPVLRAPHPVNVGGALLNHIALTLTTLALLAGWQDQAERSLREQADEDGLTGVLTRDAWQRRADGLLDRSRRYGDPLSLLMIDLDHFKRINDEGGHPAGDEVLRRFGGLLLAQARRSDLAGRYGGEEFCVLLRGSGVDAVRVDRRLREAVAALPPLPWGASVGFSSGLAVLSPGDRDIAALVQRADRALYAAKAGGRGRLVHAEPPLPRPGGSQ